MTPDMNLALDAALRYRGLGYNPLPSKMGVKGPMLNSFAEFWSEPLPDSVFSSWQTTNIQVMTGAHWRLCVVDCDGEESHTVWRQMKEAHDCVGPMPTWVARTGGGGWHYYFSLPDWIDECPSRRLWGLWDTWAGVKHQGDWRKHEEVRLLADRALVIAPPSIHVSTGQRYEFLDGRGPADYARPMEAPTWLLNLPAIVNPRTVESYQPPKLNVPRKGPGRPAGAFYERQHVLDSIDDKAALARAWGLRFATFTPNPNGWLSCYALDREDRTPSASFHAASGVYMEQREQVKLPFFDLAVALGAYSTWLDARDDLGARYCGPLASKTR